MSGNQNPQHGISQIYARLRQPWMNSGTGWIYNLMAVGLILLAGLINYDARDSQWQEWQANKAVFFADGSPLVSTTDAGYFLSYAQDYQEDRFDFPQSRSWPDNLDEPPEIDGPFDIPLLSVILKHLADTFYQGDLLMAGNAMIPFTAFLTAIAIGVCFWVAGFPAEGAIAGVGAGLSHAYFVRTSIGRIDTDQLILFFIFLILAVILLACRQPDRRRGIFFILLAAGVFHLFHWWYDRPLFLTLIPGVVFASAFMHRVGWKTCLIYTGLFILAINPIDVALSITPVILDGLGRLDLISTSITQSSLSFADPAGTITELSNYSFTAVLNRITGSFWISLTGMVGAGIWMMLYPARGIIFLPFIGLGLMSTFVGQRFAFYAAPMIWFGIGWLVLTLIRALQSQIRHQISSDRISGQLPAIGVGVAVILLLSSFQLTSIERRGLNPVRPSFPSPIIRDFTRLAAIDQGQGGVIASWWDYGYFAHFKTGLPTLHDPGSKGGGRTFLIARGFIDPNPNTLINSVRFLAQEGSDGIDENGQTLAILNKAIDASVQSASLDIPIYITVTGQMASWLRSMATHGLHNPANNTAPSEAALGEYGYFPLRCQQTGERELLCNNQKFNLNDGTVDGQPALSEVVKTENGFVRDAKNYNRPGRYTLLLEKTGENPTQVFIVPHRAWISSFNQLYRLGLHDETRLKLILDHFPAMRVYEVVK